MSRAVLVFAIVSSLPALSCKRDASIPPAPAQAASPAAAPVDIETTKSALSPSDLGSGKIEGYRTFIGRGTATDGRPLVLLRAFERNGSSLALAVSPFDLKTQIVRRDAVRAEASSWEALSATLAETPYVRALSDSKQHAAALQDAGITHVLPQEHGVVLTVDLCPSHRSEERRV